MCKHAVLVLALMQLLPAKAFLLSSPRAATGISGASAACRPGSQAAACRGSRSGVRGLRAAGEWGGDLAKEAQVCARVVQTASQVCLNLASTMKMAEESLGKEMSAGDTQAGMSVIKAGDSTPVTAADFAIQAIISEELKKAFPNDRFMGEEDAADLREDAALRAMTIGIAQQYSASSEADIMSAIDSGVEAARGKGERVWILDPIDGTKGFMTNQNYIIGLALVVDGEPIVAAMANPRLEQHDVPSIMVAVKDKGLRYWPASGAGPIPARLTPALQEKKVSWLVKMESLAKFRGPTSMGFPMTELNENGPPWLVSRPMTTGSPMPFGPRCIPDNVCCGAMIKYWSVAQGTVAGFIQYETPLKSWDHACGVLCVIESGGKATDASGNPVRFFDRTFDVDKAVVCSASDAHRNIRIALLDAAKY